MSFVTKPDIYEKVRVVLDNNNDVETIHERDIEEVNKHPSRGFVGGCYRKQFEIIPPETLDTHGWDFAPTIQRHLYKNLSAELKNREGEKSKSISVNNTGKQGEVRAIVSVYYIPNQE